MISSLRPGERRLNSWRWAYPGPEARVARNRLEGAVLSGRPLLSFQPPRAVPGSFSPVQVPLGTWRSRARHGDRMSSLMRKTVGRGQFPQHRSFARDGAVIGSPEASFDGSAIRRHTGCLGLKPGTYKPGPGRQGQGPEVATRPNVASESGQALQDALATVSLRSGGDRVPEQYRPACQDVDSLAAPVLRGQHLRQFIPHPPSRTLSEAMRPTTDRAGAEP